MHMRKHQRGLGLVGAVFLFGMIAIIATLTIKTVPIYLNQMAVARAVHKVAADPGSATASRPVLYRDLERYWDIEDIKYLDYNTCKIKQTRQGKMLSYEYEAREHLFYNISIVIEFKGEERLSTS